MKTIMYPAISLDGFIATKDGDDSWVAPEDDARYQKAVEECGCMLVGHKTYELFKDAFSKSATIFVCTRQQGLVDERNFKFITGTPQEMLEQVEAHGFKEAIICGGGEINGLFASAGLVDEIIVSVCSLTLGEGIPLFGSFTPKLKLELISTNNDVPTTVQNHYQVIRSK